MTNTIISAAGRFGSVTRGLKRARCGLVLAVTVLATVATAQTYPQLHGGNYVSGHFPFASENANSSAPVTSLYLADQGNVGIVRSDGTAGGWGVHFVDAHFGLPNGQQFAAIGLSQRKGFVQYIQGNDVAVGILAGGTIQAWGVGAGYGYPTAVYNTPGGTGWTQICLQEGGGWGAALNQNGSVAVWGNTFFESYGTVIYDLNAIPAGVHNIVKIAIASNAVAALRSDGHVFVWGHGADSYAAPPSGLVATDIACSSADGFFLAAKPDGTVAAWGQDSFGEIDGAAGLTNVKAVAAGDYAAIALHNDGTVVAWGLNQSGQVNAPSTLNNAVSITADGAAYGAITSDGQAVVWGTEFLPPDYRDTVQIAQSVFGDAPTYALHVDGSVTSSWGAIPVTLPPVKQVVTSNYQFYSAAVTAPQFDETHHFFGGTVIVWGPAADGEKNIPSRLVASKIAAGRTHILALTPDGGVVAWGSNQTGESTVPDCISEDNPMHKTVIGIAAGYDTSFAILSDGSIKAWGGFGDGITSIPPDLAYGSNTKQAVAIAVNSTAIDAIYNDPAHNVVGGVEGWTQDSPVFNPTTSPAVQIVAGYWGRAALLQDGSMLVWGYSPYSYLPERDPDYDWLNLFGGIDLYNGAFHFSENLASLSLESSQFDRICGVNPVQITIDPYYVAQNASTFARIFLANAPAPGSEGLDVNLTYDPSVSGPASVHIGEGIQVAMVPITSNSVTKPTPAYITASMGNATSTAVVTVTPAAPAPLQGMTLSAGTDIGGSTKVVTGTLTLSSVTPSDAVVYLSTSDPSVSVPKAVTIPAGSQESTPFTLSVSTVPSTLDVIVTATAGAKRYTRTLTVSPLVAKALTLTPSPAASGKVVAGKLTLSAPVAFDTVIPLTTTDATVAAPDSTVTVAAGLTSGTFHVLTGVESLTAAATISATFNGSTQSALLDVTPVTVVGLTSLADIKGLQTTQATVKLGAPAGPNGVTVLLFSDQSALTVPTSVLVPQGATSAKFTMTSTQVSSTVTCNVTASFGGSDSSEAVNVDPNPVIGLTLSSTVIGGSVQVAKGTVAFAYQVDVPATINLTSSDPTDAAVPSVVSVNAGSKSGAFTVTHGWVPSNVYVIISVPGTALAKTLRVAPNTFKVSLSPSSVVGSAGTTITGTVTFLAAVASDTIIALSSSDPTSATTNPQVTVYAGAASANFPVTPLAVAKIKSAVIAGSLSTFSASATLHVTP